jgi:hypothetical protein
MSLATNWGARALLAIAAFLVLLQFVSHLPFGRRLVLEKELPADEGVTSAPESDQRWLGVQGTAASPLHPAGVAPLDHERVDVVSDGEFIEDGEPIEVIRVDGAFVVNRRGVVDSAGTYLNAPIGPGRLSPGLGARHAAALAITTVTDATAVVISASSGTVSVYDGAVDESPLAPNGQPPAMPIDRLKS